MKTIYLFPLQRKGSVQTLCDQPKWDGKVCSVWRHWGTQHCVWTHRVLQDEPHWTVWRVPDIFVFWGKRKLVFIFSNKTHQWWWSNRFFYFLLQAFNEELYDIIQVSPKDKPITAKKLQKQQINSTTEQQPPRPEKSNRIHEVCYSDFI